MAYFYTDFYGSAFNSEGKLNEILETDQQNHSRKIFLIKISKSGCWAYHLTYFIIHEWYLEEHHT